jgi:hypothetical protein
VGGDKEAVLDRSIGAVDDRVERLRQHDGVHAGHGGDDVVEGQPPVG